VFAADAGKEVDRLASQARDGTHKVDQKLEEYRQKAEKNIDQSIKKTSTELNKAVDAFDKNVGEVSLISETRRLLKNCILTDLDRARRRQRAESQAGSVAASKACAFS
jgi:F0F1-type ATP synthase membrane subunit b/b'